MLKLFNSIHALLSTLRNSEGVKYKKDNKYSFLPHGNNLMKWVVGGTTVFHDKLD